MTRQQKKRGWKLRDLVDLEVLLEMAALWKNTWRDGVREDVEKLAANTELERRRLGFRMMLEQVRNDQNEESGQHVESGDAYFGDSGMRKFAVYACRRVGQASTDAVASRAA